MKNRNRRSPSPGSIREAARLRRGLQNLLKSLLNSHLGSKSHGPLFGVSVQSFSKDLSRIDLVFAYLAGQHYCCGEVFCDSALGSRSWWRRLRKRACRAGLRLPDSALEIHALVLTEPGAWFSVPQSFSGFASYESTWRESEARREF